MSRMSKWVTRRSVDGLEIGPPRICFDPQTIVARPGHTTVEECVAMLLADGEQCVGTADRRPIRRGEELVGYIDVTSTRPR